MRLTKRVWGQSGMMYIEAADDAGGEAFWIDHRGRLGVEDDEGGITWYALHSDMFEVVEHQPALDTAQLEIESVRLHGVAGGTWQS